MGRTICVVDADDAWAALDQIKIEALVAGGEYGGRIAAVTGLLTYSSTERTRRATAVLFPLGDSSITGTIT